MVKGGIIKTNKYIVFSGTVLFILTVLLIPRLSIASNIDNWPRITLETDDTYYGIKYGNGIFVTVGWEGEILTSPDGTTWTREGSGDNHKLWDVAYGNSAHVAVGEQSTILQSTDNGINWARTGPSLSRFFYGVTYGNSKFVVVGSMGTVLESTDGASWTVKDPMLIPTSAQLNAIATNGSNMFVAVGASGEVIYSTNGGDTWLFHVK